MTVHRVLPDRLFLSPDGKSLLAVGLVDDAREFGAADRFWFLINGGRWEGVLLETVHHHQPGRDEWTIKIPVVIS